MSHECHHYYHCLAEFIIIIIIIMIMSLTIIITVWRSSVVSSEFLRSELLSWRLAPGGGGRGALRSPWSLSRWWDHNQPSINQLTWLGLTSGGPVWSSENLIDGWLDDARQSPASLTGAGHVGRHWGWGGNSIICDTRNRNIHLWMMSYWRMRMMTRMRLCYHCSELSPADRLRPHRWDRGPWWGGKYFAVIRQIMNCGK